METFASIDRTTIGVRSFVRQCRLHGNAQDAGASQHLNLRSIIRSIVCSFVAAVVVDDAAVSVPVPVPAPCLSASLPTCLKNRKKWKSRRRHLSMGRKERNWQPSEHAHACQYGQPMRGVIPQPTPCAYTTIRAHERCNGGNCDSVHEGRKGGCVMTKSHALAWGPDDVWLVSAE